MAKLTVELQAPDKLELFKRAKREYRRPGDLAALLISEGLERRRLQPEPGQAQQPAPVKAA